jgi:hydroxyacyl-ACP dehydratase HTD2-like protein with hotdog domain
MSRRWFEDVAPADDVPPLTKTPSNIALFRFSAATWNAHRIHYDQDYARSEAQPDVVVQGYMFGAYLAQMLQDWAGDGARLLRLAYSNRRPAFAGETVTCRGRVTATREQAGEGLVDLEVWVENARGEVCAPATATLSLPRRP